MATGQTMPQPADGRDPSDDRQAKLFRKIGISAVAGSSKPENRRATARAPPLGSRTRLTEAAAGVWSARLLPLLFAQRRPFLYLAGCSNNLAAALAKELRAPWTAPSGSLAEGPVSAAAWVSAAGISVVVCAPDAGSAAGLLEDEALAFFATCRG